MSVKFYHGGYPGLKPGDLIDPTKERKVHEGCEWCEARMKDEAAMDPRSAHPEVYFTENKLYAKYYASLYGRGWLYLVEPVGDYTESEEDRVPSFRAKDVRVIRVIDKAILLTWNERRQLWREWGYFDKRREEGRAKIEVDRGVLANDPDAVRFALESTTDALRVESQRIIYQELAELEEGDTE